MFSTAVIGVPAATLPTIGTSTTSFTWLPPPAKPSETAELPYAAGVCPPFSDGSTTIKARGLDGSFFK